MHAMAVLQLPVEARSFSICIHSLAFLADSTIARTSTAILILLPLCSNPPQSSLVPRVAVERGGGGPRHELDPVPGMSVPHASPHADLPPPPPLIASLTGVVVLAITENPTDTANELVIQLRCRLIFRVRPFVPANHTSAPSCSSS